MAVVVCGVVFVLAVAAVVALRDRLGIGHTFREATIAAAAGCGGCVAVLTETLGAFGNLTFAAVLTGWVVLGLALAAITFVHRRSLAGWWRPPAPLGWVERGLITLLAVVILASGTLAALCPPNNYDVTLYHLPRQVQWLQQGSVAHFPTQDYRLTVNPPFAEFVGLHLMLLSGTDRLATAESWAAMVFTLLAVSLVAREVGLGRTGQLLAALFAATVPVGFHEAANGKNDWMVAFWLAASCYWVLRVWKAERIRAAEAVFAGLSLGLLVLTKGTGGVYAVPLVALGGLGLVARRPRSWLPAVAAVGVLTFALNTPYWSRNVSAYGSVSGKTFGLGNERQEPAVWASGLIRNVGMHLAGPKESWNRKVDKYVHRVHDWLGLGTEEPTTTWLGIPFKVEYQPQQEDFATAPVHTLLLLAALPTFAVAARRDWLRWVYLVSAAGGFVLFCVVFKWQPWHPRLHLPCVALGGVAVGWLLTRSGVRWLAPVAVAGLALSVVPAATRSTSRSLGPDGLSVFRHDAEQLRFFGQEVIQYQLQDIVSNVRAMHPTAVDLINHGSVPWEYPLTLGLRDREAPPRVGYFYPVVGSPTARPPADVVIDVGSESPPGLIRHPQTRRVYHATDRVGNFTIYRPFPIGGVADGYRLTAIGEWEPAGNGVAGDPPACDHPVARFGIGTEPPAGR